ncbi:hypothetical protein Tsubulata_042985 [Turnera subulata]|uniref:Cation/H+ exchanger domain-containing protein n=1 Tax=Turnera subulata TaxID=218843 RepID=A0A9Q0J1C6_9ROSI|nr:hypothetical protein Tsubulata_042985 [Turnera subulata]
MNSINLKHSFHYFLHCTFCSLQLLNYWTYLCCFKMNMDQAKRAMCTYGSAGHLVDSINPLITTTLQASCMLVIAQFFNLVLKHLGQPGPIAQILAGIVLSPTLLSRIDKVREFFIQSTSANWYETYQSIFGILLMFWIGLELDIPYVRRNLRKATVISLGGLSACTIFGIIMSAYIIHLFQVKTGLFSLITLFIVILANSASPVVIRMADEQKIRTADIGRLAICSSLINELSCVLLISTSWCFNAPRNFGFGVLYFFATLVLIVLNYYFALWCNKRNRNQKYLSNTEVLVILVPLISLAFLIEGSGFNSTITCFLIGLLFPRKGKTTRTLLHKLTYAINNFVLPIYFGYIGFQVNVTYLDSYTNIITVLLMFVLSCGGKIIGTLIGCHYSKTPTDEGILLSLLLNLKGHVELLVITAMSKKRAIDWLDQRIYNLVIIEVVLNTIIVGPAASLVLRAKEEHFAHKLTSLELAEPESEFRVLLCVYDPRHISSKLGLFSALSEFQMSPMSAYLMHLVELPKKNHKREELMYYQLHDGEQYIDEDDYGGNDVLEINNSVDALTLETEYLIHQRKVVSSFAKMYDDVCDDIEDLRLSIVFLTFHKHQRLDGKMESGEEGIRTTNQKLLRHAPCSVGIYVVRGQTGFQQPSLRSTQSVAVLFFGGPDDREALACARRMAPHPHINLTLIHFQLRSSDPHNEVTSADDHAEDELDKAFVEEFYESYVSTGKVGYLQKLVNDGTQTMEALRDMGDMYSLLIVGRGGRGESPMTTDLSDWEECPELGTVGDLLSSLELNITSSVLVIQQHRHSRQHLRDD